MSQWLDMTATASVGATSTVDTSGVGLWDNPVYSASPIVVPTSDKTMLYLTGAGVILALLSLMRG